MWVGLPSGQQATAISKRVPKLFKASMFAIARPCIEWTGIPILSRKRGSPDGEQAFPPHSARKGSSCLSFK